MTELGGCQVDHQGLLKSGYINNNNNNNNNNKARDASPDSLIFTPESNFSLFSSASASVDRCSFASDAHDHDDSLASELAVRLNLAGHESSGPDRDHNPDPNNNNNKNHSYASSTGRNAEKSKTVQKEDNILNIAIATSSSTASTAIEEDDSQLLDSARSSFSVALKECRDRGSRSEANFKKSDRRRPASLDLNNVVVASSSSPRLGAVNKSSVPSRRSSGTFPSPGTPNYHRHHQHQSSSVGMQKGWSSERVPLHASGNRRRQVMSAALLPLNSGKTLPSKWEDAERWILSPVSGDGAVRAPCPPPQRRPKSKSGPLGPPGVAYYSLYSPAMQVFDGGNLGSLFGGSPFSAGVIAADGLAIRSNAHGLPFALPNEPCMARSVSVHGCTELVAESSLPSHDEKLNSVKDAATDISRTVSRRDMATQMSPEGSNHSSPCRGSSFSPSTPSALPIVEVQSISSSKSEVKDVQVDERVTLTRWSKRHRPRNSRKSSDIVDDWRKKAVDVRSSAWNVSETAKSISKVKREEAKITAWENLQKAKAEAAIRKLEMKLEKKRSSSMDKIMNKLRSAQQRAQEMRSSVLANQAHQVSWTSRKAISFRKTRQMSSLSGCFTCHAF